MNPPPASSEPGSPPPSKRKPKPSTPDPAAALTERDTTSERRERAHRKTEPEIPVMPSRTPSSASAAGGTKSGAPASAGETRDSGTAPGVPPESMLGPYQLLAFIESGKTSQVWEARSADGEHRIAVKFLLPSALRQSGFRRAMWREFQTGRQFDHPQIIKYHAGHWGNLLRREAFYSMDLFLAPSLKTKLHRDFEGVQRFLGRTVEEAAQALQHVHERGYLHRDIKPANFLVNSKGSVRLIGFSLASHPTHPLEKFLWLRFRNTQGTRSYMAPEVILKQPLTRRTDLYSFGIVLFEMLTGRLPFTAATPNELLLKHLKTPPPHPSELRPGLSRRLDQIVLRMLAKQPEERYAGFDEFLEDFRGAL